MSEYDKYKQQQIRCWANSKPINNWRKDLRNTKSNQLCVDMVRELKEAGITGKALDIGAGEGYHTQDLIDMGYDSRGIELSPKRVEDARILGRPVIEGDAHYLPWAKESFNMIFMHEVLEHCAYPDKALQEIFRVLVYGGGFVISLPLEGHWKKPQNNMEEHNLDAVDNHVWKPTAKMLYDALSATGFSTFKIKLYTLDSIVYRMDYEPGKQVQGFRPHAFVKGIK